MIEVHRHGSGWRWSFISHQGRVLWQDTVEHPTDVAAAAVGKKRHTNFKQLAKEIDHD